MFRTLVGGRAPWAVCCWTTILWQVCLCTHVREGGALQEVWLVLFSDLS
jgi:hypothetical protein